jgi:hypothetical protein
MLVLLCNTIFFILQATDFVHLMEIFVIDFELCVYLFWFKSTFNVWRNVSIVITYLYKQEKSTVDEKIFVKLSTNRPYKIYDKNYFWWILNCLSQY